MNHKLFQPFKLGAISLNNRIVMAPMTRCRAGEDDIPTALMATYYAQRATAGLIITDEDFLCPPMLSADQIPEP